MQAHGLIGILFLLVCIFVLLLKNLLRGTLVMLLFLDLAQLVVSFGRGLHGETGHNGSLVRGPESGGVLAFDLGRGVQRN